MRTDISPNIVHFTKDNTIELAYQRFKKIIRDRVLIGSSEMIKGGQPCVCFSEAPLMSLETGLVNENYYSKYSPFGFLFNKKYIFSQGGRPVIYQSDVEYHFLPSSISWRHVRYEPNLERPIDFTWEREWRLPSTNLQIHPSYTHLVLPNQRWAERLKQEHHFDETTKIQQYSLIMDTEIAHQYYEEFYWHIWTLI